MRPALTRARELVWMVVCVWCEHLSHTPTHPRAKAVGQGAGCHRCWVLVGLFADEQSSRPRGRKGAMLAWVRAAARVPARGGERLSGEGVQAPNRPIGRGRGCTVGRLYGRRIVCPGRAREGSPEARPVLTRYARAARSLPWRIIVTLRFFLVGLVQRADAYNPHLLEGFGL